MKGLADDISDFLATYSLDDVLIDRVNQCKVYAKLLLGYLWHSSLGH